MAQTYAQIQRQIDALQRQAETLRAREVDGVVERIKEAIAHYGLTADQLGFGTARPGTIKSRKTTKASQDGSGAAAAYSDGSGNTWGGRGPRPRWLRDALDAGKALEDFASSRSPKKSAPSKSKPADGKRKAAKQYSDQSGNHWSGFGPKPGWLKDALAAGETLDKFAIETSNS
ncbi:H-NS family nucleoid-associated regulatory protein [Variovorax guangxiensis]